MPPTHFEGGKVNMFQPYVVGQSGTESPESVLVTRLPARTRSTVKPATNFAKRCIAGNYTGRKGRTAGKGRIGRDRSFSILPIWPVPPIQPAVPVLPVSRANSWPPRAL